MFLGITRNAYAISILLPNEPKTPEYVSISFLLCRIACFSGCPQDIVFDLFSYYGRHPIFL